MESNYMNVNKSSSNSKEKHIHTQVFINDGPVHDSGDQCKSWLDKESPDFGNDRYVRLNRKVVVKSQLKHGKTLKRKTRQMHKTNTQEYLVFDI